MKKWFSNYTSDRIGKDRDRIFGLDLFRSIAILSVMLSHVGPPDWISRKLIASGVEWFFVLSGFLIGQIIIRDFKKGVSKKDLWFFWRRRWFRTLPNYYLILCLNLVLAYAGFTALDLEAFSWKFIFFLHNFDQPFYAFFWESWSLSIEEWFYILFPFVSLLFLNIKVLSKKRALLISILCLILLPLIIKFIQPIPKGMNGFVFDHTYKKVVIYRLDSIIYGVLLAYIKVYHLNLWKRYYILLAIIGTALLQFLLTIQVDLQSKLYLMFIFPAQSIGIALLVPLFDSWLYAPKFFSKPIIWISKISYSLYLVHLGIVLSLLNYFLEDASQSWNDLYHPLYWVASILLASLIYLYFEKPITNLRPKYRNEKSQNT